MINIVLIVFVIHLHNLFIYISPIFFLLPFFSFFFYGEENTSHSYIQIICYICKKKYTLCITRHFFLKYRVVIFPDFLSCMFFSHSNIFYENPYTDIFIIENHHTYHSTYEPTTCVKCSTSPVDLI